MINEEERQAITVLKDFLKNGYTMLMLKYKDRNKTNNIIKWSLKTVLDLVNRQNKMIDLMADVINGCEISEDVCMKINENGQCTEYGKVESCKNCIKQHFEKKAVDKNIV